MRRTEPFNPDLRRLFAAEAFSSVGDGLLLVAVSVMVYEITGSAVQVGFLYVAMVLPAMVGLFAGPLIARVQPRGLLLTCDLIRAGLLAVAPFFVLSATIVPLFGCLAVVSLLSTLFSAARMSVMPDAANGIALSRVNGFDSTTFTVGQLVGMAAGGALAGYDYRLALWVDAMTFVVSALFLRGLTVGRNPTGGDQRVGAELRKSYGHVARTPILAYNVYVNGLFNLGGGIFNSMLIVYCFRELSAGSTGYTLMEISQFVGVTVGGLLLAYAAKVHRVGLWMFWGNALLGVAIIGLGFVSLLWPALLLGGMAGLANAMGTALSRTMLMEASGPDQRTQVMSLRMAFGRPCSTLGALVGSALASTFSADVVMYAAGGTILFYALVSLLCADIIRYVSPESPEDSSEHSERMVPA